MSGAPKPGPRKLFLDELVRDRLRFERERPAILFQGQKIMAWELEARMDAVAESLLLRGISNNERVAVYVNHGPELVSSILGVLASGSCCIPLDPSLPKDRVSSILRETCPAVLVTESALAEGARALGFGEATLIVDEIELTLDQGASASTPDRSPEDLAFIVYTSGSAGGPKGVELTHRALATRLSRVIRTTALDPEAVDVFWTPASFVVMIDEVFFPLMAGIPFTVVEPGMRLDPAGLVDRLLQDGVTMVRLTPSLLQMLLNSGELARWKTLKDVFCSGERLPVETQQDFFRQTGAHLFSCYGCTEAPGVLVWECDPQGPPTENSIGWPAPGVAIEVREGSGQPVRPGESGEVWLGGAGVARGYFNDPELTRAKFVGGNESGSERWYRTGDLGRVRADGLVEILGRADMAEVNVQGVRINLSEVEAALEACEGVTQAVAFVHAAESGERLCAVWRRAPGFRTQASEIRTSLLSKLPPQSVPVSLELMTSLPLTANGKVDRMKVVREFRAGVRQRRGCATVAPFTPLEAEILEIWKDLLLSDDLGVTNGFFEVGGTSLLAARLIVEMERHHNLGLPLSFVFEHQTVRQMARALEKGDMGSKSCLLRLTSGEDDRSLVLAHGIRGELFIWTDLLQNLKGSVEILGLQSSEHTFERTIPDDFGQMCQRYAEELYGLKGSLPTTLCGFSLGGMVAFETARRVQALGGVVKEVIVLDTYPLNLPPFVRRSALGRQFMKRMGVHFKSGRLGVGYLTRRARAFLTIWKAVGEQDLANAEIVQHDSADHDPEDHYLRLARRFKPVPADLKVLLVKSTAKDLGLEVLWRHLARGGFRVEDTNSPHMDILRPSGVDRTAAIVRGAMEGRPLPDSDRSHST